ncbi:hypothetical protein DFH09DRAFT_1332874 [Mycena vulgaris]|nr:hypothetical protein DFH09DRAFT_1332874 [Mycena vulgaris]
MAAPASAATVHPAMHGLVHDPAQLAALPLYTRSPNVRVVDAAQFAAMPTVHIPAHPLDGVPRVFPFLHGIKSDNPCRTVALWPPRFRALICVELRHELSGRFLKIFS